MALSLAVSAQASDTGSINESNAYVPLASAVPFVTVPTLCTQTIGSSGPSGNCNALGAAAVAAYQGIGPDTYWEAPGSYLEAKNAFVPQNTGAITGNTGWSPIFSQHKYNLFGKSTDNAGSWTREEFLFISGLTQDGGGANNGGTSPGQNTKLVYLRTLLVLNSSVTTVTVGGRTFNISDLKYYVNELGITTGGWNVVNAWGNAFFGPAIWAILSTNRSAAADLYINFSGQVNDAIPDVCGGLTSTDCSARDMWMDQVVVGYVKAWDSLGGSNHFAENFRSQVGFDPTALNLTAGTQVWMDQRIEQSVELGQAVNQASRQTFLQAIATRSTPDWGWVVAAGQGKDLAQLVSQDVEGYLMTCFNCDSAVSGANHDFVPAPLDLTFMPYTSDWHAVPSISHAAHPAVAVLQ